MPLALRAHPAPAERDAHDRVSLAVVLVSKWIGFLCGLALLIAVALIPPAADLDAVRLQRDRVLTMEQTDLQRLANYRALLDALENRDPDTLRLVLAAQLQLIPRGQTALVVPGAIEDPRLFELLEPPAPDLPYSVAPTVPSTLTRLASSDLGRLALLTGAGLAILWGLMPPVTRQR